MLSDPIIILPLERYPASWVLSSTTALDGSCEVGFTSDSEPDATTTFYAASWADTDATATSRVTQAVVAGSAVASGGDAFPGVGDYTAWVRYTDLTGMVRVRSAGLIRFR